MCWKRKTGRPPTDEELQDERTERELRRQLYALEDTKEREHRAAMRKEDIARLRQRIREHGTEPWA